jgi:hypothetical protein
MRQWNLPRRLADLGSALTRAFSTVSDTAVTVVTGRTLGADLFVPQTDPSGTPAQHGLYKANLPKAWAAVSSAPALSDSFNLTSVADGGAGIITVTLDRDFANTTYAVVGSAAPNYFVNFDTKAAGSVRVVLTEHDGTNDDVAFDFIAFGDQ